MSNEALADPGTTSISAGGFAEYGAADASLEARQRISAEHSNVVACNSFIPELFKLNCCFTIAGEAPALAAQANRMG